MVLLPIAVRDPFYVNVSRYGYGSRYKIGNILTALSAYIEKKYCILYIIGLNMGYY